MIAMVGPQVGRIGRTGSDPWGRFSWQEMKDHRDQGILIISAYRVSQTKGTKSGPTTSYSRQLNVMIIKGDTSLDPRSRILQDLRKFITDKRAEGFRPILMMDANDEWIDSGSKAFQNFVTEMQLEDLLYEKFGEAGITSTTYSQGSRRIDFILVDSML